ncbi:MAG: methionine--tRNA ligase [Candidatus Tyloplasma litorale]|nr:MAG: methionine--tRNA ligase [Mycoplasmatales bacterium]
MNDFKNKKFYVTTPIYYPNYKLHIGHAYTTTLADYVSRYKKMQGYETMFLTGSDEHGQKIEDRAKEANEDTLKFVTKIIKDFKKLWLKLDIDYDLFIRTTDETHKEYVKESFTQLLKKDFIYKSKYSGLYCKSDEAYFTETQIKENKCPECGKELIVMEEESYFLKISAFKDWIKDELLNSDILKPKHRVNELVNNFVNDLQDLSVTRTSINWGIQINEDTSHVIYVWLDALQNYISALKYPESKFTIEEVWNKNSEVELLQLVGKEITRFHCIYWPIILKMKGYRKPSVLAHGWLISDDGDKMSKSKGNVVDPLELIKIYGSDEIKFYLVNNIVTGEDGKFSEELLIEMINGLLVNKYSNLVSRTDAMIKKYCKGIVPENKINYLPTKNLTIKLEKIREDYYQKMDNYEFSNSTKLLINYVEEINLYIDLTKPWKNSGEELNATLNTLVKEIFNVTTLLSSVLTTSYKKVYQWLSIKKKPSISLLDKDFKGVKLNKIEHLFERIKK